MKLKVQTRENATLLALQITEIIGGQNGHCVL
jgi:hypothetical protein